MFMQVLEKEDLQASPIASHGRSDEGSTRLLREFAGPCTCLYPVWQADQWKIYPCEITPWTVIKKWYEEGTFVPYGEPVPCPRS